eukprot:TRINITY_DN7204_c0_g1_i1.p2 TRINITY_DN7204_c0_g1~~TRINITY_DN7204_c0_g1_i1.p2  ORF type:complete len:126 (-),score=54.56 TRINITY_DN7204_c0_g1_i1:2-379(-)
MYLCCCGGAAAAAAAAEVHGAAPAAAAAGVWGWQRADNGVSAEPAGEHAAAARAAATVAGAAAAAAAAAEGVQLLAPAPSAAAVISLVHVGATAAFHAGDYARVEGIERERDALAAHHRFNTHTR